MRNKVSKERVEEVIKKACKFNGVKKEDVLSAKRHRHIADTRYMIMEILYSKLGMSYVDIADVLNRTDHTAIVYGRGLMEKLNNTDRIFKVRFEMLNRYIFEDSNIE